MATTSCPSLWPQLSDPLPDDAPHLASFAFEFEMRLEVYDRRKRRQSFLRRYLIDALSKVALVSLEMATRLDK